MRTVTRSRVKIIQHARPNASIETRDGKEVLTVATEVCKKRELIGMDLMMVMAAAVELTEPTQ